MIQWSIEDVENNEELLTGGEPLVTEALMWHSLATGLGKDWSLDADFAPEFFARVKLLEQLNGPMLVSSTGEHPITWEEVSRRIGMRVNVGPISRAAFVKNAVGKKLDATARECRASVGELA